MAASETDDANSPAFSFTRFLKVKGANEIVLISILLSIGIGSVVGLVPDNIADRYARLEYGYAGEDCALFDHANKPDACQRGADDAQAAAAWSNAFLSLLSLVGNPLMGSLSDRLWGRRPIILLSLGLACLPSLAFWLMQTTTWIPPVWYYAANSLTGAVNYMSITFAALTDITPPEFRAQGFGIFLAGYFGGYALAASLSLLLVDHVPLLSFLVTVGAFLLAVCILPETLLLEQVREENSEPSGLQESCSKASICKAVERPFHELAILNRGNCIRMLAVGAFFSSMVFASDVTLVLYYIEDHLDVREKDIATMFFALGIAGISVQGGLLQPLVKCVGEKTLLVLTFACGALHNLLYGVARSKSTIYLALVASQFTKLNFPLLSSVASKNVHETQQGRLQGALAATNAIAYAIGPMSMEAVYNVTKTRAHFGPGFMFIYATALYAIGTIVIACAPVKPATANFAEHDEAIEAHDLEEPLLLRENDVSSNFGA